MEAVFEISRKLNLLNLQAASLRFQTKTGFIYYDEAHPFDVNTKLIPTLENFAYCLALLNQKNAGSFHLAEKLLTKLFSYYKQANFPRYIHEFPDFMNPFVGIWSYPFLKKMHDHYGSFFSKNIANQLHFIIEEIRGSCNTIEPYHHLRPLHDVILGKAPTELSLTWESGLAYALSKDKQWSHVVIAQDIKFLERGALMLSVFDYVKAHKESFYPPRLLLDHPHHLKLAIFYDPFAKNTDKELPIIKKNFLNGLLWHSSTREEYIVSYDDINVTCEKIPNGMILKGELELHQEFGIYFPIGVNFTQSNQKGTYFIKNQTIVGQGCEKKFQIMSSNNLGVLYQKRKEELFEVSSLALKNFTSGPFEIRLNWN